MASPLVLKVPYYALCFALDMFFDGRPIDRFWFLETVARVPYFSYTTMLHAYETLGWWRLGAVAKRIHFAEEWNEYHHLLIMESLGGDRRWITRFLAGHSAVVYFFVLSGLWLISPSLAYNFSGARPDPAVIGPPATLQRGLRPRPARAAGAPLRRRAH